MKQFLKKYWLALLITGGLAYFFVKKWNQPKLTVAGATAGFAGGGGSAGGSGAGSDW